jgi:hypothetical protein
VLVTTALGTTDAKSLEVANRLGVDVRIYNPGRGTFHPKLYLGRHGSRARAFIGSANMTSGLAGNIEAGLAFDGAATDDVLSAAWSWAEALWHEPIVEYWDPGSRPPIPPTERFDAALFPLLRPLRGRTFLTLARRQPNTIADVEEDGLVIRTNRSPQGQRVPAWMFNIAWSWLTTHGRLANQYLCDELRVKRSAGVIAVLAQLPGVRVFDERTATIELARSP